MIHFWTYFNEYKQYRPKFLNLIDKTLKRGKIFFGENLSTFEKNFRKKYKCKYAIAVGSGTDAILISLLSLNLKKGDEVITASNTAIPTISAIVNSGAKPVLVDINDDYLIDINKLKKAISKKTKVVIPVHLYGKACKMDEINNICKKKKIHIIEDCAQAQGAKFMNKFVGTFGSLGCFSFYPTKILGGYGDGGLILTNNYKLYKNAKNIRFYGIDTVNNKNKFFKKYYSNINGVNSRLDEINSSILNFKLEKVDTFINKRRAIANIYDNALKNTSLILPKKNELNFDVYHQYTVYHSKRNKITNALKKNGIETRIIYPYPIHKMKGYKTYFKDAKFINSEKKSKGIFCLPIYPDLKIKDVKLICKNIIKIMNYIN